MFLLEVIHLCQDDGSFLAFVLYLIIGDNAKMSDRPMKNSGNVSLLSSKWLQKNIILGKCAIHDYLIYRRVRTVSRFMTFMFWVEETETGFLSVHYFDCSKYNCTCKLK